MQMLRFLALLTFSLSVPWGLSGQATEAWYDHTSGTVQVDHETTASTPPDWKELLQIYRITADDQRTPLIGRYTFEGGILSFKPRVPFSQKQSYLAWVKRAERIQEFAFSIPVVEQQTPTLVDVYPSSSELPMNLLKFYIDFDSPIQSGQVSDKVRLYKMPENELVADAFLKIVEELWDSDHTRLTVFLDPGRIKTGIAPNLQLGLSIVQGNQYRLVVERKWKDQYGGQTKNGFVKDFQAVSMDRTSPQIEDWRISTLLPASQNPLVIDFPEPLDYGLAQRLIVVCDEAGEVIPGKVALTDNETKWTFTPASPWNETTYFLHVNTWLEDLAGNNLIRLFDENIEERSTELLQHTTKKIPIQSRDQLLHKRNNEQ